MKKKDENESVELDDDFQKAYDDVNYVIEEKHFDVN